jgi:hypothetical protein
MVPSVAATIVTLSSGVCRGVHADQAHIIVDGADSALTKR